MRITGSCLCGGVKIAILGPMRGPLNCHCEHCRKQHGAAFRSRVRVRVADLEWVCGEDLVKYYESTSGFRRGFCQNCGSPVVNHVAKMGEFGVPLGILDDDPGIQPQFHVYTSRKAPWFEITDSLPQHTQLP